MSIKTEKMRDNLKKQTQIGVSYGCNRLIKMLL